MHNFVPCRRLRPEKDIGYVAVVEFEVPSMCENLNYTYVYIYVYLVSLLNVDFLIAFSTKEKKKNERTNKKENTVVQSSPRFDPSILIVVYLPGEHHGTSAPEETRTK